MPSNEKSSKSNAKIASSGSTASSLDASIASISDHTHRLSVQIQATMIAALTLQGQCVY